MDQTGHREHIHDVFCRLLVHTRLDTIPPFCYLMGSIEFCGSGVLALRAASSLSVLVLRSV